MAVALPIVDNDTIVQYTSVGETIFTYDFPILAEDELKVSVNQSVKSLGGDYTVTGVGDAGGGTVVFASATTAGNIITIWQDMPLKRATGYVDGAATLLADDLNDEAVRALRTDQQIRREARLAIRLPADDTNTASSMELPDVGTRAGKFMRFSDTGALEMASIVDLATGQALTASLIGELIYPRDAQEIADNYTPVDISKPYGHAERYGCVADNSTNNYPFIQDAIKYCIAGGYVLQFGFGIYYVEFTAGSPGNQLRVEGDLSVQGMGNDLTGIRFGPNDAAFDIHGWKFFAVNSNVRGILAIPPQLTAIATTLFDNLFQWSFVYYSCSTVAGVSQKHEAIWDRCNTTKGWTKPFRLTGDGSAGWKLTVETSRLHGYVIVVPGSNSDDATVSEEPRELHLRNLDLTGHNNEGPDWAGRGRVIYVHPTFSIDWRNIVMRGSGAGRPMMSQYSSGAIPWHVRPPRYLRADNITMDRPTDSWPSSEGFQTSNIPGVVSYYSNMVINVDDRAARIRHNTVLIKCHITGTAKSLASSQPSPIKSYMAVAGVATDLVVVLKNASRWSDTDYIGFWLDDFTLHETTVNGAPVNNGDGTWNVTITDALPSGIAVNRWVIHTFYGGISGITTEWIRLIGCTFDNDPFPDACLAPNDRVKVYVSDSDIFLTTLGAGSGFYHDNVTGEGGHLISSNNNYTVVGASIGLVAELENSTAFASFTNDTFEGETDGGLMVLADAQEVIFKDIESNVDDFGANASFCTGALAQNVLRGPGNKFNGTAKPRLTNSQRLTPPAGEVNPTDVTITAGVLVIDLNYAIHRVTSTGTITNILFENDATVDQMMAGGVQLVALNAAGFTIQHQAGGKLKMPGGINLPKAQHEAASLIFDPEKGTIVAIA